MCQVGDGSAVGMQTARGRCGARPLSGRMMSGAPTGRVTASGLPARYTCSWAGRCAASEQPPHESDKNALPDHLLSRVRPRYVRAPGRTRHFPRVRTLRSCAPTSSPGPVGGTGGGPCSPTSRRCAPRSTTGACGRQHRLLDGFADDRPRGLPPGLRHHPLQLHGRRGRPVLAGAAGRSRPVRRRVRRHLRPAQLGLLAASGAAVRWCCWRSPRSPDSTTSGCCTRSWPCSRSASR